MEGNGTEIKGSPLLATRNEAKQGHSEVMLPHRVRVSGGPNEATAVSFPASPLGVNEAKQGQMGPGINPLHTSALISPGRGCGIPAFAERRGFRGNVGEGCPYGSACSTANRSSAGGDACPLLLFLQQTTLPLSRNAHVCTPGAGRAERDGAEAVPYGCRTPAEWPASISSVVGAS